MSRRGNRLASVLRVRRLQEEQARGVAQVLAHEATAAEAVHQLAQERLDAMPETTGDASSWAGTRAGLLARATHAAALGHAAQQSTEQADEARAQWLARHERVALLERLAEAHRASAARGVQAAQQSAGDDVTSARWGREQLP